MTTRTIVIAKEFSEAPAGRFITDGPFTGELFRENFLIPSLASGDDLLVDLDGTLGYGSSFLEEAFGGLVRKGLPASDLRKRIKLKSDRTFYIERIWRYISDAEMELKGASGKKN